MIEAIEKEIEREICEYLATPMRQQKTSTHDWDPEICRCSRCGLSRVEFDAIVPEYPQ